MRTLACSILAASALLALARGATAADAGAILLDAQLVALDGTPVETAELRGHVVVVNFWATWCRPCQHELAALDAWRTELADRGVRFVAVSVDADRKKVDRFVQKHGIGLTVVHDGPNGLARQLDLPTLPCTYVLDGSGAVAWTARAGDASTLEQLHQELLTLAPAATEEVSR